MTRETDYLIQSLFERENLDEMTLDELKGMADQYPFSSIVQFLYTCKLKSLYHLDFPESVAKTAVFFNNPYWLNHQLSEDAEKGHFRLSTYDTYVPEDTENELNPSDLEEDITDPEDTFHPHSNLQESSHETVKDESFTIPIEPYHTIDYFASQGIDLNKETQKDEFSAKVKSFTAWLKTMKRLQPPTENIPVKDSEETMGEISNEVPADEVITETMAEVYLKQGMKEKAIAIYRKLSLQNPANSRTFADKILQIKENKI